MPGFVTCPASSHANERLELLDYLLAGGIVLVVQRLRLGEDGLVIRIGFLLGARHRRRRRLLAQLRRTARCPFLSVVEGTAGVAQRALQLTTRYFFAACLGSGGVAAGINGGPKTERVGDHARLLTLRRMPPTRLKPLCRQSAAARRPMHRALRASSRSWPQRRGYKPPG